MKSFAFLFNESGAGLRASILVHREKPLGPGGTILTVMEEVTEGLHTWLTHSQDGRAMADKLNAGLCAADVALLESCLRVTSCMMHFAARGIRVCVRSRDESYAVFVSDAVVCPHVFSHDAVLLPMFGRKVKNTYLGPLYNEHVARIADILERKAAAERDLANIMLEADYKAKRLWVEPATPAVPFEL